MAVRPATDDTVRRRILDSALDVFIRYGFRKTSMDDIARGADLSRQGLYLHFKSKDELIRAVASHAVQTNLEKVERALAQDRPTEERLLEVFKIWHGQWVEARSTHASEVYESTTTSSSEALSTIVDDGERVFLEFVARELKVSGVVEAHRDHTVSAVELAATLLATSKGLKISCRSLRSYVKSMRLAISILFAPVSVPTRTAG